MNSRVRRSIHFLPLWLAGIALLMAACGTGRLAAPAQQVLAAGEQPASVSYTLKTALVEGKLAFVGQGW